MDNYSVFTAADGSRHTYFLSNNVSSSAGYCLYYKNLDDNTQKMLYPFDYSYNAEELIVGHFSLQFSEDSGAVYADMSADTASARSVNTLFLCSDSRTVSADIYTDVMRLHETGNLPMSDYTLRVTGLSTPVSFKMKYGNIPASITAYGHTVPLNERISLFGNCGVHLFEYSGAVVFTWDYYGIGYAHVISPGGVDTVSPGVDSSAMISLDDNGRLIWQRFNN